MPNLDIKQRGHEGKVERLCREPWCCGMCLLVNARLSGFSHEENWNDLRIHKKTKQNHLKAEQWVPVRDFSCMPRQTEEKRLEKLHLCFSSRL